MPVTKERGLQQWGEVALCPHCGVWMPTVAAPSHSLCVHVGMSWSRNCPTTTLKCIFFTCCQHRCHGSFKSKMQDLSCWKNKKKSEMSLPHLWIWLQPWMVRFNIPSCLAISCQKWPERCWREANSYSEIYYSTNPPLALLIKSKLHLPNDCVPFCRTAMWYLFVLSPWVSWSFQWVEEALM